jgi:hypothetical protein
MLSLLLTVLLLAGSAPADPPDGPLTTAEASGFTATTRHADVLAFLDAVAASGVIHVDTFGESYEGRALPLAVAGAPGTTAADVRQPGKLRVLVLANIHAGEVAGKEAALILLREIAAGRHDALLDSLVVMVAPIYNADGNERIDARNRPLQHGPVDGMGTRANAQGLDLNRDMEKLDSPEARALVRLLNTHDPHLLIDLHTTNGTTHAYHLTYAAPLHPITHPAITELLNHELLPAVQGGMRQRGFETFEYGNDKPEWGQPPGWATFDPRPRFVTNYVGLIDRLAILSEAYSYATFEERVAASGAFVEEILAFAAENGERLRRALRASREPALGTLGRWPVRAAGTYLRGPEPLTILMGDVEEEAHPETGEPMWRRTDTVTPVAMDDFLRFGGSDPERVPAAYLVPTDLTDVIERLEIHGVRMMDAGTWSASGGMEVEAFRVDSVRALRPFQNRQPVQVYGRYEAAGPLDPAGFVLVCAQPERSRLAFLLLEPMSDSGFAHWGIVPARADERYPIVRIMRAPAGEEPC